jgi:hypothetical protein
VEQLAAWMIANGFATGHGDTMEDLLRELTWQVAELRARAAYDDRIAERDALLEAARDLLLQIDDGPRGCYGKMSNGEDMWKASFLSRVERMRQLVARLDAGDGLER